MKPDNTRARWASVCTGSEWNPWFPLTLPGTGGSRVRSFSKGRTSWHVFYSFPKGKLADKTALRFYHGKDAAAPRTVKGTVAINNNVGDRKTPKKPKECI
jgi:hypothetical protein